MCQTNENYSIFSKNKIPNLSNLQEHTSPSLSERSSQAQTPNISPNNEKIAKKVTFSPEVVKDYCIRYNNNIKTNKNITNYIIPGTIFFNHSIEEPKLIRLTLAIINNMPVEQKGLQEQGLKLQDIITTNNVCKYHFKKSQKRSKILKKKFHPK